MDYTNAALPSKTDNPIVYEEVNNFLRAMERRGATVKDLNEAIGQLQGISFSLSTNAPIKSDALDKLPDNPFRSILNGMLQDKR